MHSDIFRDDIETAKKATAFHEAGHVAAILILGGKLRHVAINNDEIERRYGIKSERSLTYLERLYLWPRDAGVTSWSGHPDPCVGAVVCRAGALAELAMYPYNFRMRCSRTDFKNVRHYDRNCNRHVIAVHRQSARNIVLTTQKQIAVIAEALLAKGHLEGPEVLEIWNSFGKE